MKTKTVVVLTALVLLIALAVSPALAGATGLTPKEQLGKAIFFDTRLSTPNGMSCGTVSRPRRRVRRPAPRLPGLAGRRPGPLRQPQRELRRLRLLQRHVHVHAGHGADEHGRLVRRPVLGRALVDARRPGQAAFPEPARDEQPRRARRPRRRAQRQVRAALQVGLRRDLARPPEQEPSGRTWHSPTTASPTPSPPTRPRARSTASARSTTSTCTARRS